jgi:FAD/FMN-containing dehydrogenase
MKVPNIVKKNNDRMIAYPRNTKEVSNIIKYSNKNGMNIIPIGGETNRVDGTRPDANTKNIFISFSKMNKILEIDTDNLILTVETGVTLQKIQEKSLSKNLFFPVNIAPSDKCTIGGNISTNVGGLQTLKYGNIEDHINGLEVVLSDGTILNFLSKLKKDNFGPKLWKIFCGSEGIFGIITKANLNLKPRYKYTTTYFLELSNLNKTILLFKRLRHEFYDHLTSFEIIFPIPSSILLNKRSNFHLIVEMHSNEKNKFQIPLKNIFQKYLAKIIKIENNIKNSWIWKKREDLVHIQKNLNYNHKFDISLPLSQWKNFISKTNKFVKTYKQFSPYFFGHLGDGNLHCNFKVENEKEKDIKLLHKYIYELTLSLNGSIAAEHGLGQKKNMLLKKYKSKEYYNFLKNFKKHLDPNNNLGVNKLFKS